MLHHAVRKLPRLSCLLAILGSSTFVAPAFAADDAIALGNASYAKGQFSLARIYFQSASSSQPRNWLAYYHLANCDVKLGDLKMAEQEYRTCVELNKDPAVAKLCLPAIKAISGHRGKGSIIQAQDADDEAKRHQLAGKLAAKAGADFQKLRDDALAKREKIFAEGKARAQAARANAQAEIQHLAQNGNWICQNSRTGAISVTVPTSIADEITARGEEEAARIMRDYENRAAGIFVPDYDNTVHHLVSALTDKSKHGPKLSHHGTSVHVRTYTHSPTDSAKKGDGKLIAGSQAQASSTK